MSKKAERSIRPLVLGVDEHAVIKTLIFETNEKKPLIILMHGDLRFRRKIWRGI